jgi:hypothetical protein
LLLKVAFILYFVFDAFNGIFSDDDNDNAILPKPFQGYYQTWTDFE